MKPTKRRHTSVYRINSPGYKAVSHILFEDDNWYYEVTAIKKRAGEYEDSEAVVAKLKPRAEAAWEALTGDAE